MRFHRHQSIVIARSEHILIGPQPMLKTLILKLAKIGLNKLNKMEEKDVLSAQLSID